MSESKMEILTEVTYRHGYFSNRLCRGLSTRPAGGGDREMINQGLLLRERPGGFVLLYDSRHAGTERDRADFLGRGLVIRLLLRLNEPDFYNYTTPAPEEIANQVFFFYNRLGQSAMHWEDQVSSKDLYFFQRKWMQEAEQIPAKGGGSGDGVDGVKDDNDFPGDKWILEQRTGEQKRIILENREGAAMEKPFAILDLHLEPWTEAKYQILFQPSATWWNYVLAGEHLKQLDRPAIINSRTRESFTGPSVVQLTDERAGLSFVSPAPIGLREEPADTCMLVENFDLATGKYKVVMADLPRPDPRMVSGVQMRNRGIRKEGEGKNDLFSEIILY